MDCPKCGYHKTLVTECRELKRDETIRRRRECQKCGYRFTTYEYIVNAEIKDENSARRMLKRIKNILDDYNQENKL